MTVTPNGSIYLCKTKLENDYKNELTFSDANSQLTYFNSTIYRTFTDYTYIKKDNSIKHAINISKEADRYSIDTKPDDDKPDMNSVTFTHQGRENGDTSQITLHAKTNTIKEINNGSDTIKGQVFIKKSNNKNRSVNNQAVHNITGETVRMKAGKVKKKLTP